MKKTYKYLPYLLLCIAIIIIAIQCKPDPPKVVTKTKVITVTDTIIKTHIEEVPVVRYVKQIETVKGKDSIIYVDKPVAPDPDVIKANEFSAAITSNKASADLKILSTGTVLDVSGVITYPELQTTTTIYRDRSALFLYGETSVSPAFERAEIGLDYQIKNKLIIGASIDYHNISKQLGANLKIGFKIL